MQDAANTQRPYCTKYNKALGFVNAALYDVIFIPTVETLHATSLHRLTPSNS
jgi:hypothetical protein